MAEYIEREALLAEYDRQHTGEPGRARKLIEDAHTIDAVPVTASELKHLINDTIAYIWQMEERGLDKPEYGYESRKDLLEKLKQFEKEHFPEMDCTCG